jgi:hypoxanthine phosphoribosyltransferase
LDKPDARAYSIIVDYLGFSIPNKFVVGYGLDYNGLGRNMGEIFMLDE